MDFTADFITDFTVDFIHRFQYAFPLQSSLQISLPKSDLQAVKIRLVCLLGMFHVRQLQWRFHFALSFTMGHDFYSFGIGLISIQWQSMGHDLFFGINTDLRI